jgi:ribosomal RNA-processing protein 1
MEGFWMSDKPLVQQRLAADLAELLLLIKPAEEEARLEAALGFLAGFWEAMCREWAGLDRLRYDSSLYTVRSWNNADGMNRQDKFYMLMRRYVNATFRLLAREGWSEESVDAANRILTENGGPLT